MRAPKTCAVFALLCLLTAWGAQAIEGDRHRYCSCGVNPNLPGADPHLRHYFCPVDPAVDPDLYAQKTENLYAQNCCQKIPPPMLPKDNLDWKFLITDKQRSMIKQKIKVAENELAEATTEFEKSYKLSRLLECEWTQRVVDSYLKLAKAEGIPEGSRLPEVPEEAQAEERLKEERQLSDYFEQHRTGTDYNVSWKESKSGIIAAPMLGASVLLFISSAILMHKWILHRKSKAHSKK